MNEDKIRKFKESLVDKITLYRKDFKWQKVEETIAEYRELLDTLLDGNDILMINDCFYLTLYEIEANTYTGKSHLNYRRILYALSLLEQYPDYPEQIDPEKMEVVENIPQFKAECYSYMAEALYDDKRVNDAIGIFRKSLDYLTIGPEEADLKKMEELLEWFTVCFKYLSVDPQTYLPNLNDLFSRYFSEAEIERIAQQARTSLLKHDPIEDTPRFLEIKEEMETLLYEQFKGEEQYMGFCFEFWSAKRSLLLSKYGIEWRSPASMNPSVMFD